MSTNNRDNRTATQRIEDLEKVVSMFYQALAEIHNTIKGLPALQQDMALVRDALKLLNRKAEAIIQSASESSGINYPAVEAIVIKYNVEDLAKQVAGYVAGGQIRPTDTVLTTGFVVGEELNADGTLNNPRTQFRVDSVNETTRDALLGKKVGDLISFGEGKLDLRVLEVYDMTPAQAPTAETPATDAPAADAAPAETQAAESAPDAAPAEAPAADPTPAPAADPTPEAAAPATELPALPAETPIAEFVPSDLSNAVTAAS
jgi:uncharacterized coiled-coil protein SlyX